MLANQTETTAAMFDFLFRSGESPILITFSLPISATQKRDLLVAPGSRDSLFSQDLLEMVSGQVKEDSFISSTMSLAKLAWSSSLGRGKSSSSGSFSSSQGAGSSGCYSPLDYGRAGPSSSSSKRSASPSHGGKAGGGGGGVVSFTEIQKEFSEVGAIPVPLWSASVPPGARILG